MAKVAIPEEIPVQRLPVYARCERNLYHWAGKILVPKGQLITPDLVAALVEAGIDVLYTDGCRRARPDSLEELDIYSIQEGVPLQYAVFDRDGNLLAREGERLRGAEVEALHRRGQKKIYYFREGPTGQAARFEASYSSRLRSHLDEIIVFGRRRKKGPSGIPINRFARVFSGRAHQAPLVGAAQAFYDRAVRDLGEMWCKLASGGYIRNPELAPLVNEILERFLGDREIYAAMAFSQPNLPLRAEHSVATAIYALFAAQRLDYNRAQARDLIVAALFHDVGYVLIPPQLLDAERSLSKGERRVIFRHIEHALLLTSRIDWPGDAWRIGVYQHQERGTGAGYPSGYKADRIHEYARILAAADVLHALVSDRPHRGAHLGSKAMNMLMKMAAMGLLDAKIVRILARELSLYPVGSTVSLSTGEIARVVASSREPHNPWVGVILSADTHRQAEPKIIDLSRYAGVTIRAEVEPFEEPFAGF